MKKSIIFAWGAMTVVLISVLVGCTLLQEKADLDGANSPAAESLAEIAVTNPTVKSGEQVAIEIVLRSGYYQDVSESILDHVPPCVERLPLGSYAVVFALELSGSQRLESDFHVYPYAIFFVEPGSRQLVNAYCVTPDLANEQLLLESLLQDEERIQPMSVCLVEELQQMRELARSRRDHNGIVGVKRPCDDSITQPVTECWCAEVIPAHMDYGCLSDCWAVCDLIPSEWARLACYGGCSVSCLVPATCAEVECETIYPCNW